MNMKFNRAFTLIELLFVVAIIGLLSTIVLGAVNDAREKAEWSKFDSEILEVRTAIELYRSDNSDTWEADLGIGEEVIFSSVVSELNTRGYYPGDAPTTPGTIRVIKFYPGRLVQTNGGMSCGNRSSDVYYAIYFEEENDDKSNVFKRPMYWGLSQTNYGWVCFEILK